jgi:hypothetical protein
MTSPGRADTTLNGWRTESYQVTSHARSGPSRLDAIPGPSRQIPQMPSPSEAVEEKVRPNPRTTPPLSMLRSERQRASRNPQPSKAGFETRLAALACSSTSRHRSARAAPQPAAPFCGLRSERQRASRNPRPSKAGFERRPEEAEERGRLEGTRLAALACSSTSRHRSAGAAPQPAEPFCASCPSTTRASADVTAR